MKRSLSLGLIGFFCFTASACLFGRQARADIIETTKDGIMNGKILSDDGKEVHFKDAKGKTHKYAKREVLFIEKEDPSKKAKQAARNAGDWLKKLPENAQKTSAQLSEKFVGTVGKPLDRSAANAKADSLARAMDEANRASASTMQKTSAFNKEVYRQKSEAEAVAASSASKKGRFASLD